MAISDKSWWRWFVLAGTFYISFTVDGYNFAFGILKLDIEHEHHGHISKELIAIIGGLVPALYCLLAPIAFGFVAVFSVRTLTICGALLSAIGFLLAFANRYLEWGFALDLISLGVIQGLASALLYGPSINLIPSYFRLKEKALATGITTCGSPAGAIAYGFMMHILIDSFGWRGSMLFFTGFSIVIIVAGLAFVPKSNKTDESRRRSDGSNSLELGNGAVDKLSESPILKPLLLGKPENEKTTMERLKEEFRNIFNRELFTDYVFITLLIAMAFSILGYYVPTLLVTGQAKDPAFQVSEHIQKYLIWLWGIANLVGRLFVGWLADFGRFYRLCSSLSLFVVGLLVSAACLLVFPHVMVYGDTAFITFVVIYGFFSAPFITLRSTIVQDLYYDRQKQIGSSFGWTLWAEGLVIVAGFSLPTFFNSIDPLYAYVFAAGSFIMSAIFLVVSIRHFNRMFDKKVADMIRQERNEKALMG